MSKLSKATKIMKKHFSKILFQVALIFALATCVLAEDYSDYTGCAEQDSLALVAFFNATGGEDWTSQKYNGDEYPIDNLKDDVKTYYSTDYTYAGRGKWLEGPVKDWFGVLLEKQPIGSSGDSTWRVVHLHPTLGRRENGNNNISGYIPREVGYLTALDWFKLNGNTGLTDSELPDEIYHSTLTKFDVEKTFMGGILGEKFRNCTQLDYINLRYVKFDTMPALDFLSEDHLLETFAESGQVIWFYDSRYSFACLEPTVKYFMSVSDDIKYEARNNTDVGRKKEVILSKGESVTITCNEAGDEGINLYWLKNGTYDYTTYSKKSLTVSDTGSYTVLIQNEYIEENAADQDYSNVFTKPIHVVYEPVTPKYDSIYTSYSGREITIEFDKFMAVPNSAQTSEFTVKNGSNEITVTDISRTGWLKNRIVLTLKSPVDGDSVVKVSYSQGSLVCKNGGKVESFSDIKANNFTREKPTLVEAETYINGESIILTFDKFMDESSIDKNDFTVTVNDTIRPIYKARLIDGEIDDEISKQVELIFSDFIEATDTVLVSYSQGDLTGLYSGMPKSFANSNVKNTVDSIQVDYVLRVIDGSESLDNLIIKSEMRRIDIKLVDDATSGDETSGDHTWSYKFTCPQSTYSWEVYQRTYVYDTISSNSDTILLVVNEEESIDSLISSNVTLSLTVDTAGNVGDSIYEYCNKTITFILDLNDYLTENETISADPYLMGIDDDWSDGISMSALDNYENTYYTQITKRNTGEILTYNFRNNYVWENADASSRTHTIVDDDTINAEFGDYINSITSDPVSYDEITVFPNPTDSYLNISLPNNTIAISTEIFNITGNVIQEISNTETIPVSSLSKGLYCIKVIDNNNNIYISRFIKL